MPLHVTRADPTTLVVTRRFRAPPARVYAAHTDAALLARWLGGYEGWDMPLCESDARPGGAFRYHFARSDGSGGFDITGTYVSLEPPEGGRAGRTVHLEVMHLPDPTPENHVETVFAPEGDGTLLTMTMRLPDAASMDAMVGSGMTNGMEFTYGRLDALEP